MAFDAAFTPREVAELSGAPKRAVEKAIEEGVLRVRLARGWSANGHARRRLPTHAVAYAAILTKLDLKLSIAHKKRLFFRLARIRPPDISRARIELAPAVEIDVGRLIGDTMTRAERYRAARDALIEVDQEIMGGTTVIRGTRMTVYSVLGRIEHGDSVDDILAENPDLSREAMEAAIIYARTHPLMGRPGGRPWVDAA
jgi:uncharacterized protein (DUF433 family)